MFIYHTIYKEEEKKRFEVPQIWYLWEAKHLMDPKSSKRNTNKLHDWQSPAQYSSRIYVHQKHGLRYVIKVVESEMELELDQIRERTIGLILSLLLIQSEFSISYFF